MVHENDVSYCDWGVGGMFCVYPMALSFLKELAKTTLEISDEWYKCLS